MKGNFFFAIYNPLARVFARREKGASEAIKDPSAQKILLCCLANLGDVLLACSVIPAIKQKWPQAKIGFLASKASAAVLTTQAGIDWVHVMDREMILHKAKGIWNFFSFFFLGSKELIEEIKEKQYDISIELHPFFPNTIPIAKKAKIQKRVGFDSGGFDVWLSHVVPFPETHDYLPSLYAHLLREIGIETDVFKTQIDSSPSSWVEEQLAKHGNYLVLHVGTSDPRKEWPLQAWQSLAEKLIHDGYGLIFTGKGKKEKEKIETMMQGLPHCYHACDLPWKDFCDLIKRSQGVISVDSVPVHLAACLDVPLVALYLYNHYLDLWLPQTHRGRWVISKACKRQKTHLSSPHVFLTEKIEVEHVYQKVKELIGETT